MEAAPGGYRLGVTERPRWPAPGAEPRSLTERRDAVVEEAFAAGVDGLKAAYDAYGGVIHRFCARTLGPDAAGDATQEVFVAAWRDRERFDPARGSAGGLAHGHRPQQGEGRAARHRPPPRAHGGRDRRDRRRRPTPWTPWPTAWWWPGRCGRCPSDRRSVVRLAYLEGHSHQEVADRSACRWAP